MTEYKFDANARIRFSCEAETVEEAVDQFSDILSNTDVELKIDVDSYSPEEGAV